MAYFISAKQAREKARKDSVINSETASIEAAVLTAVESNLLTATVDDGTTMTESNSGDAAQVLAESYHSVWQGGTTDATKTEILSMSVLVGFIFLVGLFPFPFIEVIGDGVDQLLLHVQGA